MSVPDEARRYRLFTRIASLPDDRLPDLEAFVDHLLASPASAIAPEVVSAGVAPPPCAPVAPRADLDWPHAPTHRVSEFGTYFVTCGTYQKPHHFRGVGRLDHLHAELLRHLKAEGWHLEAWAVFSNHYHFVAHMLQGATPLSDLLRELHRRTALYVNEQDNEPGRQVWYNYWDTKLTFETSYFARLAYTHTNAVKHGLVPDARLYPWCSASWLERVAKPAQVATLAKIKTDRVHVPDDFEPLWT